MSSGDPHPHPSSLITPESVRAFLPGSFPGDLGIEPIEIEDDLARGHIVVDQRHLHPGGFVHGGVWTALGDTVAAWSTFRNIPPGHNFTTIELKLNVFAAGVLGDEIIATGEPLHVGRSTVVIEVRIERRREGKDPRTAANLIVTQFVLPPRRRRGLGLASALGLGGFDRRRGGPPICSICGRRQSRLAIVRPIAAESSDRNHWLELSSVISKNSRSGLTARIPA